MMGQPLKVPTYYLYLVYLNVVVLRLYQREQAINKDCYLLHLVQL